jgi:hypothetical protein
MNLLRTSAQPTARRLSIGHCPIAFVSASKRSASSFSNGSATSSSTRRLICCATYQNASLTAPSSPSVFDGSGEDQCATIGLPGQTEQASRALSQTVMTKSNSTSLNSSTDLLRASEVSYLEVVSKDCQRNRLRCALRIDSGAEHLKPVFACLAE